MKDIYIPHLNYRVRVRQLKPHPDLPHAQAWVSADDRNNCTLYLDLKHKLIAGDVAHELIHVLQAICLNRNMDFRIETEHMAYLMHWLMGEVMGYEWK